MCWFLYGAVNGRIDEDALVDVNARHECHIIKGTRHDLKMAILNDGWDYRLTNNNCDCDSEVGRHDPSAPLVKDLSALLTDVAALSGTDTVSFSHTWANTRNKHEKTMKLSDVDWPQLLADLEPSTLYMVDCRK